MTLAAATVSDVTLAAATVSDVTLAAVTVADVTLATAAVAVDVIAFCDSATSERESTVVLTSGAAAVDWSLEASALTSQADTRLLCSETADDVTQILFDFVNVSLTNLALSLGFTGAIVL